MAKAVQKRPKRLLVVPSTMRLHQLITLTPVIYGDVSALLSSLLSDSRVLHHIKLLSDVQPLISDTTEHLHAQTTDEIKWEAKLLSDGVVFSNLMMTFILEPLSR